MIGSRKAEQREAEAVPRWPRFGDGQRLRVLIEHPDPLGQQVLADAFRERGYEALTCGGPSAQGATMTHCPVVMGDPCPAVDGADVVVSSLQAGQGIEARVIQGIVADPIGPPLLLEATGWQLQQADLAGPVEARCFPFQSPAKVVDRVAQLLEETTSE